MTFDGLISVCMPVYNGEKYISEAIESILLDDSAIEIVICDDNSNDNSEEIINSIKDNRIKYYKFEENVGLAGNWNRCVKLSSGDYVKFLAQDDVLKRDSIYSFRKAIYEKPDARLFFCKNEQIDSKGKIIRYREPFARNKIWETNELVDTLIIRGNFVGGPSNTLIKKKALIDMGLFDQRSVYALDYLMWVKLAYYFPVYYINENLVSIREHEKSVTTTLNKDCKTYSDMFLVFGILQDELGIKDTFIRKRRKELSKSLFKSIVKFSFVRDDVSFFRAKLIYDTNAEFSFGSLLVKCFALSFVRKFLASNFSFLISKRN